MSRHLVTAIAAGALAATLGLHALVAAAAAGVKPTRPAPVVVQYTRHGFEWGDAAIGAGAAVGLVLVVTGALVLRKEGGTSS